MQFQIRNLGLIGKADVDLADLTVICGKNNTGKTYVAYGNVYFSVAISRTHALDAFIAQHFAGGPMLDCIDHARLPVIFNYMNFGCQVYV